MMSASEALGWVSVGEELQIVQHFSLGVVSFFGALITVFVGTGMIYKEIDKRTIYTILSKPVRRWQFVLGKFLGQLVVMGCIVLGMGLVANLFVIYAAYTNSAKGADWTALVNWGMYWQALALIFAELAIVTALAVFFSTLASPVLAAIFTFCSYLVGQFSPSLIKLMNMESSDVSVASVTGEHLTDAVSSVHWLLAPASEVMYVVLPNLTHFQLRNRIVFGPAVDHGKYFVDGEFFMAVVYACCYSAVVLLLAAMLFDRKKF
jgi:ABC-type transport system involved in multi-copper enzyme maturation permease subunit